MTKAPYRRRLSYLWPRVVVYERHVPPVELGFPARAAPAEPFRIVMRGSPYKPRLPRDRKLWPVVFPLPFPLLPFSRAFFFFPRVCQPLASSSWPMRQRKTDVARVPAHGFSLFPAVGGRGTFLPSIAFGYRGYKVKPNSLACSVYPSPFAPCCVYGLRWRSFGENEFHFLRQKVRARSTTRGLTCLAAVRRAPSRFPRCRYCPRFSMPNETPGILRIRPNSTLDTRKVPL